MWRDGESRRWGERLYAARTTDERGREEVATATWYVKRNVYTRPQRAMRGFILD